MIFVTFHFRPARGSHINKAACILSFAENPKIARGPTRFGARSAIFLTPIYFCSMIFGMNQPSIAISLANFLAPSRSSWFGWPVLNNRKALPLQ